jgi:hypothetical protein
MQRNPQTSYYLISEQIKTFIIFHYCLHGSASKSAFVRQLFQRSYCIERLKTQKQINLKFTLPVQSWATTVEKVSDNRHGQSTANTPDTRLVTPGSQEPCSNTHLTATPNDLLSASTQHLTIVIRQPTTKKLPPTTNPNGTNNRQQIGVKQIAPIR